jgi:hypothetical protein
VTCSGSHIAGFTIKETLAIIKRDSASAYKLRALVKQLVKGLQKAITEKEIGEKPLNGPIVPRPVSMTENYFKKQGSLLLRKWLSS